MTPRCSKSTATIRQLSLQNSRAECREVIGLLWNLGGIAQRAWGGCIPIDKFDRNNLAGLESLSAQACEAKESPTADHLVRPHQLSQSPTSSLKFHDAIPNVK